MPFNVTQKQYMKRKVIIKDSIALIKSINFMPMFIFIQGNVLACMAGGVVACITLCRGSVLHICV